MWMLMDTLFPPVKINFRPLNILHIAWVVDAASFCSSQITDQVYLHVFMFFSAHWVFPDIFNYFKHILSVRCWANCIGWWEGATVQANHCPLHLSAGYLWILLPQIWPEDCWLNYCLIIESEIIYSDFTKPCVGILSFANVRKGISVFF